MYGRNGSDSLNRFLLVMAFVFCILSMIFKNTAGSVLSSMVLVLLVISYFRILSKNLYKRRAENDKYLTLKYALTGKLRLQKERWKQRRDYCFFDCPSCKSTMRVPKNKGRIDIVCRKCGTTFTRKT